MKTYLRAALAALLIACPVAAWAADIDRGQAPLPAGTLWARKSGTTVTVQDIESTSNALHVYTTGGTAPTPPTGTSATQVQGPVADGAADTAASPVEIGGTDGTNIQTIKVTSTGAVEVSFSTVDPCQSSGTAKSSVAVSATADTELVAISGSTVVYVCGFSLNAAAGTAPSFRLTYGTGAVCATGTVGLTGVYLQSLNGTASYGGGATIGKTIAGQALCIDVGGTTPDIRGIVTYVQL